VVNVGAYAGDDPQWRAFSRSSNAHSTLIVEQHSQGGFLSGGEMAQAQPDEHSGAHPETLPAAHPGALIGPLEVLVDEAAPLSLQARHYGYQERFGLVHRRQLKLECDGLRLVGVDRLEGRPGFGRAAFEIRFHLHPFVEVARADDENLLLTLPDGEIWRFHASNIGLDVDDGVYLAYKRGIEAIHQIVLYGDAPDDHEIHWLFEQYRDRGEE